MSTTTKKRIKIKTGPNYYSLEVQGKANEPICVAKYLQRAQAYLKKDLHVSLEEIVERLEENAPRVAIILGSPDQPAHVTDWETSFMAAASIWNQGGVPFVFGIPVVCDGTAQSTPGMSYSLASRNLVTAMVINQMEGQLYHGAFVLQGCDKTPSAIVCALASLDRTRQARGEAPVFATFAPAHVLRGGTIPDDVMEELLLVARQAEVRGEKEIAEDIQYTLEHLLQCSSNQAFQGILNRAVQMGLVSSKKQKDIEKRLAVNTCHSEGGICAFNGTGNTSRYLTSALGLVHPALEFLTSPPTYQQVDASVSAMMEVCNNPRYSVSNLVLSNVENAIRIHSTMGGSTNWMMHLVACVIYAGRRFDIHDYDRLRRRVSIPDLFDFSLTQGRDVFVLAQQCSRGQVRGIETMLYELRRNGVPISEKAPTMAAATWGKRLRAGKKLSADRVKRNPIILSTPRRATSGIDVLKGNFFESAVVKISGMSEQQLDAFDEKVALVLYMESEEEAVSHLLHPDILESVIHSSAISIPLLLHIYKRNNKKSPDHLKTIKTKKELLHRIVEEGAFRLAIVIAGQGPEAYGMPEMFTPMQHINHNMMLKRIATVISDGRYSGVSYGAAIGHMTPEAIHKGGILYLKTGDLLHLRLRKRAIHLLDSRMFSKGKLNLYRGILSKDRSRLGLKRLRNLFQRRTMIDPSNLMNHVTDAAHGVVPQEVWLRARKKN